LTFRELSGGDFGSMVVAFTTVKLVAGLAPKVTAVAPLKPVPVIVTVVPPAVGPNVGLRLVIVGMSA
jgi:hypothetical protein